MSAETSGPAGLPPPARRWRGRLLRKSPALLFAGLPLLVLGALAAGWVRSHRIQEVYDADRSWTTPEADGTTTRTSCRVEVETDAGRLGLTLRLEATTRPVPPEPPFYFPGQGAWVGGWHWQGGPVDHRAESADLPPWATGRMPSAAAPVPIPEGGRAGPLGFLSIQGSWGRWGLVWPDFKSRAFGRGGEPTGWAGGVDWSHDADARAKGRSRLATSTTTVAAPFWAWMVPCLAPVVAWCWCPPGRPLPRLSVRRALLATAALAAYLGALLHVPADDRTVLALRKFNPHWLVGPAPGGSGRAAIGAVRVLRDYTSHSAIIPSPREVALIRSALARLADLRVLALGHPRLGEVEIGAMLPDDLPRLAILDLSDSTATDATLARVARYRGLRQLWLGNTAVTDAGLAHLRALDELADLDLADLDLTDAGLAHLRGHPRLRWLNLRSTELADPNRAWQRIDAGLSRLADATATLVDLGRPRGLPLLRRLGSCSGLWARSVTGEVDPPPASPLTEAALRRLADSLPSLEELVRPDGTVLRPDRPEMGRTP